MHIALYHDAVIPPKKYGGTERLVFWLGKALIQLGHEVTLIARPGSRLEGAHLVEIEPGKTEPGQMAAWQHKLPSGIDLIHLQAPPTSPPPMPYLLTIHGNGKPGERFLPNTVFISEQHARNHSGSFFVHNGIDPSEYFCDDHRDDSLVFLAKGAWKVKNLIGAIELARAAHLPLKVMGSRDWPLGLHRLLPAYRGVHYLGMVDDTEKKALLRSARALLFPVRWPEPFGLAVIEALASGCGVFATPYGSLPELLTPETGFLSTNATELLRAIQIQKFDPRQCRSRAIDFFSHTQMAKNYLKLYAQVLEQGTLTHQEQAPHCTFVESPQTLLPYEFLK